ncbi:MAG: GNAT family N-acetyltransferase [Pseudoclavibacter sp.]
MTTTNEYGQPIGEAVPGWVARSVETAPAIEGTFCRLERLDADRHADDLFAAHAAAPDDRAWTYLPEGPFADADESRAWATRMAAAADQLHYAVIDGAGRAVGTMALLRIDPANGSIEVGWLVFSKALQRTPASTEAQFLLMRHVFDDLGYRRYEWKCDSLNATSRAAAARLGFVFEGVFRKNSIYKGRERDTAWFALTLDDWPRVRSAFEAWLDPANFDDEGRQRERLRARSEG